MAKVIVERPRGGARVKEPKGYRKRWLRLSPEDFPKSEGIGRKWSGNGKWLRALSAYGVAVYAATKRLLSKREIGRLPVRDPAGESAR